MTVVIEMASNNYAAYVPDLPGCVATASTREELLEEVREAIGRRLRPPLRGQFGLPALHCAGKAVSRRSPLRKGMYYRYDFLPSNFLVAERWSSPESSAKVMAA